MPRNDAAFAFLATRQSYPSKLMAGPAPENAPDRAALEPILHAALRVPDHGKLEPWRLIVLGRDGLTRVADLAEARARELGGRCGKDRERPRPIRPLRPRRGGDRLAQSLRQDPRHRTDALRRGTLPVAGECRHGSRLGGQLADGLGQP